MNYIFVLFSVPLYLSVNEEYCDEGIISPKTPRPSSFYDTFLRPQKDTIFKIYISGNICWKIWFPGEYYTVHVSDRRC